MCISVITAISSFRLLAEIGDQDVRSLLYFPSFHELMNKSKHELPVYKLWQYLAKDKSSVPISKTTHFSNKKFLSTKSAPPAYNLRLKRVRTVIKNYITQFNFINQKKWALLRYMSPFCNFDNCNISWRIFGFISRIYMTECILTCIKNVLKSGKNRGYRGRNFGQNDLISQNDNGAMWCYVSNLSKMNIYIGKIFHHRVYS